MKTTTIIFLFLFIACRPTPSPQNGRQFVKGKGYAQGITYENFLNTWNDRDSIDLPLFYFNDSDFHIVTKRIKGNASPDRRSDSKPLEWIDDNSFRANLFFRNDPAWTFRIKSFDNDSVLIYIDDSQDEYFWVEY